MNSDPQPEIERDLLAYKQRRREQAEGAFELHPATRKMLQSEAARATGRPMLTSEEAAKNFVRSFVMSHQRPGFFARNRPRIIWAGAMFACLVLVLAVLRNDPRQREQSRAFSDALPTPPAAPASESETRSAGTVADQRAQTLGESLARDRRNAPVADEKPAIARSLATPAPIPAPANRPALEAVHTPVRPLQNGGPATRSDLAISPVSPAAAPVSAPLSGSPPAPRVQRESGQVENSAVRPGVTYADKRLAEKKQAGDLLPLAVARKAAVEPVGVADPAARPASLRAESQQNKELKIPEAGRATGFGVQLTPPAPSGAPPGPVLVGATAMRRTDAARLGVEAGGAGVPVQQRFQQLDARAGYRQNFNSPPVPPVLQDFAFERHGDKVRIVDADGSTYEGVVLPLPTAPASALEAGTKAKVSQEHLDADVRSAQPGSIPAGYGFTASGLNRKLNQLVEFRGTWQPGSGQPSDVPALQAAIRKDVLFKTQDVVKQEKASFSTPSAPANEAVLSQAAANSVRISGRAVVGGQSEFHVNAVPR